MVGPIKAFSIHLRFQCPATDTAAVHEMDVTGRVEIDGGWCCGQEGCYCPSPEITISIEKCPVCDGQHEVRVK